MYSMLIGIVHIYYAVWKDHPVSFPHQLASMVKIGGLTFDLMLIKYLMRDGVIPT